MVLYRVIHVSKRGVQFTSRGQSTLHVFTDDGFRIGFKIGAVRTMKELKLNNLFKNILVHLSPNICNMGIQGLLDNLSLHQV